MLLTALLSSPCQRLPVFGQGLMLVMKGSRAASLRFTQDPSESVLQSPLCRYVGQLCQEIHDCTTPTLHAGFKQFWDPWWNRDSPSEAVNLAEWPAFLDILQRYPQPWSQAPVDMLDVQVWRRVLQKSKSRSAVGVCGFSVAELKQLPDLALGHLAQLCDRAVQYGFPTCLLQGRINTLAKVQCPSGYNDGRPICILPVIYRLFGSVFCQQMLKFWATRMPPSITGGLPGRAARDVTFALQQAIECSQVHRVLY